MRTPARQSRLDEHGRKEIEEAELPERREEHLPMVAIVGRPNVGKSTLFNRLADAPRALVHDKPGMTRDRRIERVEWGGVAFLCVDTGGFDVGLDDPLKIDVVSQARLAMGEADVIIMLTSVGEDLHPAEEDMVKILRRASKPVIVAVNKCDNRNLDHTSSDFFRYGFDQVYPISALHGRGVADMLDVVKEFVRETVEPARPFISGGIRVAVVGRQNVGKSTLINQLLGEERMIASELPGTTRDAIDAQLVTPDGTAFTLVDTAGIRRRGKVERGVEKISVLSSMIALRRADVGVVVVDGSEGLTAQDAHIASYCVDEGCACVLAVNKWDLVEKDHRTADLFTKTLEREWPFLRYATVVYISAKTGQRASRVLDAARLAYTNAGRRIPTPELNDRLAAWMRRKAPPSKKGRQAKLKYITQVGIHPPTFVLSVNDRKLFHFSYERYLINRIRDEYDFESTPIRLVLRGRPQRRRI